MKTKLCVSLFVENISDTIAKAKRAIENGADVIEFRLDSVEQESFLLNHFISELKRRFFFSKSIFTVRSQKEFGKWKYSERERRDFLLDIAQHKPQFLDVEFTCGKQFIQQLYKISPQTTFILSSHKKYLSSSQLFSLYDKMKSYNCKVIKIAVETKVIEQTLPIFSLLEKAKEEQQKLIAIGMGTHGEITRILAPKYHAYLSFASPDDSSQTASGQLSLDKLLNVYNFKKINTQTKIFGLLGNPVAHSKGIYVHNAAFRATKTNAVYVNCEIENVTQFDKLRSVFDGFSVTSPHKEKVIKHLDALSPEVKTLGAVNTIIMRNEKLYGDNFDGIGFRNSLPNNIQLKKKRVAILGSGGAAKSIIAALKNENTDITIFCRTVTKTKRFAHTYSCNVNFLTNFSASEFDMMINTIPYTVSRNFPKQFSLEHKHWSRKIVCDVVYNPVETPFLNIAKKNNATVVHGWKMFLHQALMQFELFTRKKAPISIMKSALLQSLKKRNSSLVLCHL